MVIISYCFFSCTNLENYSFFFLIILDGCVNVPQKALCICSASKYADSYGSPSFSIFNFVTYGIKAICNFDSHAYTSMQEALKSIADGDYGICKMCSELIAINRLKAKPFAKYCTICREIHEANNN